MITLKIVGDYTDIVSLIDRVRPASFTSTPSERTNFDATSYLGRTTQVTSKGQLQIASQVDFGDLLRCSLQNAWICPSPTKLGLLQNFRTPMLQADTVWWIPIQGLCWPCLYLRRHWSKQDQKYTEQALDRKFLPNVGHDYMAQPDLLFKWPPHFNST